jgi:flagellar biosynthesis protein FlhF
MNVKRFTGRTSREAMQKVRQAFGDDAVVLSTKPATEGGVEVMAMAGDSIPRMVEDHEPMDEPLPRTAPVASWMKENNEPAAGKGALASMASSVQDDVRQLAMSTLSFQEYVRDRMLRRRQAAMKSRMEPEMAQTPEEQLTQRVAPQRSAPIIQKTDDADHTDLSSPPLRLVKDEEPLPRSQPRPAARPSAGTLDDMFPHDRSRKGPTASNPADLTIDAVVPRRAPAAHLPDDKARQALAAAHEANESMLGELRAMRELMKERFQTMAFIDQLQRTPGQAQMAQQLLDSGFSPALIRKMVAGLANKNPDDGLDEMTWSAQVLQRNLNTAEREPNLEDQTGVFALIGATGVGKTTCTAKLAALFAAKHGAHNLGLITLDAYRMGAHEQLRSYGRILGVPVHIAHDRAALEDLLELLASKKLILIDTAGMPQRDTRTRELLEMISHDSIKKLLVINAAHQGDCIEDVMAAYQAPTCAGIVLSKLDEAVKLGPAIDALVRHKLKLLAVTNGQRVPEDWHRLSGAALVQRALRVNLNPAYRFEPNELSLVFSSEQTNLETMPTVV